MQNVSWFSMQGNDCPGNNTKEDMYSRLYLLHTNTFHMLFQGIWWSHQEEGGYSALTVRNYLPGITVVLKTDSNAKQGTQRRKIGVCESSIKDSSDHNMKGQIGGGCPWINIRHSKGETKNLSID